MINDDLKQLLSSDVRSIFQTQSAEDLELLACLYLTRQQSRQFKINPFKLAVALLDRSRLFIVSLEFILTFGKEIRHNNYQISDVVLLCAQCLDDEIFAEVAARYVALRLFADLKLCAQFEEILKPLTETKSSYSNDLTDIVSYTMSIHEALEHYRVTCECGECDEIDYPPWGKGRAFTEALDTWDCNNGESYCSDELSAAVDYALQSVMRRAPFTILPAIAWREIAIQYLENVEACKRLSNVAAFQYYDRQFVSMRGTEKRLIEHMAVMHSFPFAAANYVRECWSQEVKLDVLPNQYHNLTLENILSQGADIIRQKALLRYLEKLPDTSKRRLPGYAISRYVGWNDSQ